MSQANRVDTCAQCFNEHVVYRPLQQQARTRRAHLSGVEKRSVQSLVLGCLEVRIGEDDVRLKIDEADFIKLAPSELLPVREIRSTLLLDANASPTSAPPVTRLKTP